MVASTPLRELFVYPIERYIPPVAKVNDLAEAIVAADLREYVVTGPIEDALRAFLEGYAESRTATTDRIGVWISGFFGAGKSHFAKMLGYLLENRLVGDQTARQLFAARLAGSAQRMEIEGLLHRAGLLDSRVITFQIKAEQDLTAKDDSISEIMYRSYLASRGLSKNIAVASLELSLIERGLYDAFRAEVERRMGRPWAEEREDFLFIRATVAEALQTVAPAAYRSREEALAALDLLRASQQLSVSDLAARLTDYVDELARGGNPERPPRLVFIIDEMGQFIGDDGQKLLELQSIAEEFATRGRGKLWLIVTSQAKLDELIAGVKAKQADFSKIGQRFDTRLALTADDVEKVLEGRILQKQPERAADIEGFYHAHAGALASLGALPGASRSLPAMSAERFAANTPFLPYHLPLIQAIFGAVKSATATGFGINPEARSMIGMAMGVLSNRANGFTGGELGRTVALDMVYDRIAADILPQDRQEIENLEQRLPGWQALDSRVLKALYLLQQVSWVAVTADTLAHALVRDVRSDNLAALQAAVAASLERLRDARYVVTKENGAWEFLTGAKKSFEEEAAGVIVRQADVRRAARTRLAEVLRPIGKLNYRDGLRSFDVVVRGDGEELQGGQDLVLEVYSSIYRQLEERFSLEDLEQIESFSRPETVFWAADPDADLANQLTRLIKLNDVLGKWQARQTKTDEEREIIREKGTEVSTLQTKIETSLRTALYNGVVIWNGRAEELDGRTTTLNPIFNRVLSQVVPTVYPKFDLAAVRPAEDDIKAALTIASHALVAVGSGLNLFGADGHLNQHSAAVAEVRAEIAGRARRGSDLDGKALEERFTGAPYGWHPTVVRLILAALFRAGLISAKADNVHYTDHTAPAAQALFTQVRPFRRAVFFYEEAEAITPDELRRAQDELKLIFETPRREETANVLAEQIVKELNEWNGRAERVVLQLRPAGYPIPPALTGSTDLVQRVTRHSNPGKIVKAFLAALDEVRGWHAETATLHDFIRRKRPALFQQAKYLLAEIGRSEGLPGTEPLSAEDALAWRAALSALVSGGAAHAWDDFTAAFVPLGERFRQVYAGMHAERDRLLAEAEARLGESAIPATALTRYRCRGLRWAEGEITKCGQCDLSLRELDLQITALPGEERRLRDQHRVVYRDETGTGPQPPRVKYLKVAQVLAQKQAKPRIASEAELDQTLNILRDEVKQALAEADAVELE
ncbi:MAG: BREX system P-loop protein BrxC [Chloroflexi bacterium]|nr:BREX system P-loop protein BrxC [Chloroflexota bacterium]